MQTCWAIDFSCWNYSVSPDRNQNNRKKCKRIIRDLKLSLCCECCILSLGWFSSVRILYAYILEVFVFTWPMKMEQTGCSRTLAHKLQIPGNPPPPKKRDTTMEMNFRPYLMGNRFLWIPTSLLVANVMFMMWQILIHLGKEALVSWFTRSETFLIHEGNYSCMNSPQCQ